LKVRSTHFVHSLKDLLEKPILSDMGNLMSATPLEKAPETQWFKGVEGLPSMKGKLVAITGCTSGTGLVLAKTCGKLGAHVVMLNRPSERADAALKTLQDESIKATLVPCDLCSFASVRQAADELRNLCKDGIDVLCNNAGLMGLADEATGDGCDVQMQANHLSHFLLTSEVWPLLEAAATSRGEARVVNHSSGARNAPGKPIMSAEHLQMNGGNLGGDGFPGLGKWQRYQQSKLANLLFTYTLHDYAQKRGSNVKSLCAHPGPTYSGLQQKTSESTNRMLDNYILNGVYKNCHSTEDGSMGITRCCCEAGVESKQFYGPSLVGKPGPAELLPEERNEGEKLLWDESVKTTGAKWL